jgi:hypothetical protein
VLPFVAGAVCVVVSALLWLRIDAVPIEATA